MGARLTVERSNRVLKDEEDDCNRVLCILNLDEVDCGLWTVWRGATGCFAHPEG